MNDKEKLNESEKYNILGKALIRCGCLMYADSSKIGTLKKEVIEPFKYTIMTTIRLLSSMGRKFQNSVPIFSTPFNPNYS